MSEVASVGGASAGEPGPDGFVPAAGVESGVLGCE